MRHPLGLFVLLSVRVCEENNLARDTGNFASK